MDFGTLSAELEDLIAKGQSTEVRARLEALSIQQLPRRNLAEISNFARRSGNPEFSLRSLSPIVRPTDRLETPANSKEQAVYAAALARVGAVTEALSLLEGIKDDSTPEAQIYLAYAHIYQ